MKRNLCRRLLVTLCLYALFSATLFAAAPPRLVVVVSVDQWRHEYFQRFQRNLEAAGIAKRCQRQGLWFGNCFHQHAFTYTGPGHSVLMTGAYPSRSGIIDNNWYDRELGETVYCVADAEAEIIGTTADETPVSPKPLLVDTIGDQLKLATGGRAKVFGIAIKDRAAILMAGRMANAAYWMSGDGKWITSSHYGDRLPGYLRNLTEQRSAYRYVGKSWDLLLPPDQYVHGEENSEFERPVYGMTPDFPHVLPTADDEKFDEHYIKNVAGSPFGNLVTLEAAEQLIVHEKLGADAIPDILAVNLSSTDYVGHAFGPYSLEVEDTTYRTDRRLGQFADFIDRQLDGRPWLLVITSDHGVAPIPERAAARGLRAERNPMGELKEQEQLLEAKLLRELPLTKKQKRQKRSLVQAIVSNQVFLNLEHPGLRGETLELARRLTRDFLLNHPYVAHAATREQLLQDCSGDPMLHMLKRSYHAKRSGDVVYVMKPYTLNGDGGTTHGSPWSYDRHVPLMLCSNRKLQVVDIPEEVSPASLAPTLATILGIELPAACDERRLKISFGE